MGIFADWLNSELENRGWSQSELARRAGINQVTVSRIINEGRKVGPSVAKKIAHALGVREEEVFRKVGLLPELKNPAVWNDEIAKLADDITSPKNRTLAYEMLKSIAIRERSERGYTQDQSGDADEQR